MPANVDSMFAVRQPPWHGEGVVIEDYPGSWDAARTLAGLDWEPSDEPAYRLVGMGADGTPAYEPVTGHKLITRSDTGAVLATATDSYEIISHKQMGEIVEAVLATDDVKYETAGSLAGGRRVWALAQLGDAVELPGDPSPTLRYLALLNSHDGSAALKAIGTGIRVVCQNTWHAADVGAQRSGTAYAFKHTKNWQSRVTDARKAVTGAYAHLDSYIEQARKLLATRVTREQEDEFLHLFAVERVVASNPSLRTKPASSWMNSPAAARTMSGAVSSLRMILDSQTCAGLAPTAYRLVQAAGEFADHVRPAHNSDTYFSRTVLTPEPLKAAATRLALAYA